MKLEELPALIVSVIGCLFLSGLFLRAILSPAEHADFILKTGILIFVIEFLTMHSSVMLGKRDEIEQKGWKAFFGKMFFIILYSLFAIGTGYGTQNWILPLVFFISLVAKVFGKKATKDMTWFPVILLMAAQMLAIFPGQLLQTYAPLETELYDAIMARSSGMENIPLFFIIWGVIYYFLFAVVEIILFFWKKPLGEKVHAVFSRVKVE